jgi:hypothetical protein
MSDDSVGRHPFGRELIAAIAIGLVVGYLVWVGEGPPSPPRTDWDYFWVAARALVHGQDPYAGVAAEVAAGRLDVPLYYPATAPLVLAPLGALPRRLAFSLWAGGGIGLLAFALARQGRWRLWGLLSAPVLVATFQGQWSTWLTAGAMLPWLSFVWAAKPSIGLALFAGWPSRRAAVGAALVVLLSLIVVPGWIGEWLEVIRGTPHYLAPVQRPWGFLLLLAFLRWRRPEARMLGALALIPHTTNPYDMVPLLLIPQTRLELAAFMGLGYVAQALIEAPLRVPPYDPPDLAVRWLAINWGTFLVLIYLPCLLMVLRQRQDEPVPSSVESQGDTHTDADA